MNKKLNTVVYTELEDRTKLLYTTFGNFRLRRYPADEYNEDCIVIQQFDEEGKDYGDIAMITKDGIK